MHLIATLLLAAAHADPSADSFLIYEPSFDTRTHCDDVASSILFLVESRASSDEELTLRIEDSGGWTTAPTLSETTFTLTAYESHKLFLNDGARSSMSTPAWVDVAISSDYGTNTERVYAAPNYAHSDYVYQPAELGEEEELTGTFAYHFSAACTASDAHREMNVALAGQDLDFTDIIEASSGALSAELSAYGNATIWLPCDGNKYTFWAIGRLHDPTHDGTFGLTVVEYATDNSGFDTVSVGACSEDQIRIQGTQEDHTKGVLDWLAEQEEKDSTNAQKGDAGE